MPVPVGPLAVVVLAEVVGTTTTTLDVVVITEVANVVDSVALLVVLSVKEMKLTYAPCWSI